MSAIGKSGSKLRRIYVDNIRNPRVLGTGEAKALAGFFIVQNHVDTHNGAVAQFGRAGV